MGCGRTRRCPTSASSAAEPDRREVGARRVPPSSSASSTAERSATLAARDDADDERGVGAERRRDLARVEHAHAPGGAGADVDEPAAPAQARDDRVDGGGDLRCGLGTAATACALSSLHRHELRLGRACRSKPACASLTPSVESSSSRSRSATCSGDWFGAGVMVPSPGFDACVDAFECRVRSMVTDARPRAAREVEVARTRRERARARGRECRARARTAARASCSSRGART